MPGAPRRRLRSRGARRHAGRDRRARARGVPGLFRPAGRDRVHAAQRLAPHRRRGPIRRRWLALLRQAQAREGADQAGRRERVPGRGRVGDHADEGRERRVRVRRPRCAVGRGDQGGRRGAPGRPLHGTAGERVRRHADRALQAPHQRRLHRRPAPHRGGRRGPGRREKPLGRRGVNPPRIVYETPRVAPAPGEAVVTSTCGHNCGGRCVVNAHVRDGRIVKISTDPRKWTPEMPPLHACVRGFGQLERVHHPDRLLHPLRRVGSRGSGQVQRIGWDEALDEVARQMLRVRDTYGPAAILDCSRTGSLSMLHSRATVQRLLHMFGGCTELWTNISSQAEVFAVGITYGAKADYKSAGREPIDYVNSRLIVMWGWSPADGTFGTGTLQYLKWAKKQGVRIVCVDPRLTRSSHELADEHVFIRPSTDAAALIAMAYVIASEGLQDQAYLDLHVLGFDDAHLPPGAPRGASYRSYLMGEADGIRKTPEWASAITGVPAETIWRLAIEFGTTKPAALHCGYAPGRTVHGEQFHRAAYALAAMTGNVGAPCGNSGTSNGTTGRYGIRSLPVGANPAAARVASPLLADLLERGRAGGYPADVKMIYSAAGDLFNQLPNVGKTIAAAGRLEFMVGHDPFITR